jgi:hypothetical protein
MMNDKLHMMLAEQRHKAHIREADDHRRAKELRAAREQVSLWRRIAGQPAERKPANTRQSCAGHGCETAVSESI